MAQINSEYADRLSALQAGGSYDSVEIQGRPPSWADVFAVFAAKTAGAADGESVAVALSQVGNVGSQPYWSWYGFNSRVEWCACFVSWCANECGYIDAGVIPKFAGCTGGSNWFKNQGQGQGQDGSYEPRPGDLRRC